MSEEEIIEVLKNHAQYTNAKVINANTKKEYKVNAAIQGLLDLYNKEKEKNKELENADLTTVYMNGFYDGEKKWKDKIKSRLHDTINWLDGGKYTHYGLNPYELKAVKKELEFLLEEDNK